MDSIEFGQLITALRKQTMNTQNHPWTREELGQLIHMSSHQLGRIERGTRKYLEIETLQLLADAFNLTSLERKEFFLAAQGVSAHDIVEGAAEEISSLPELMAIFEKIQEPAFILDGYADVVIVNSSALMLQEVDEGYLSTAATAPAGFNLLRFIYAEEGGARERFGSRWKEVALNNLQFFRRVSLRYRHKPYFMTVLEEMHKHKDFFIHWYNVNRFPRFYDSAYDQYEINHSRHGLLKFVVMETTIATGHGNLYLIHYLPRDHKTAMLFMELADKTGTGAVQLAPWPDKTEDQKVL